METFYYNTNIDIYKGNCDVATVGGKIKYYRLKSGLRQVDISNKTGLDLCTIIRYENNQRDHSLENCKKIAQAIGIEPELIYDDYLSFIASNYGEKIKGLRLKLGLTQAEMGNVLGVSKKTISRWENEKVYLSRETMLIIRQFWMF